MNTLVQIERTHVRRRSLRKWGIVLLILACIVATPSFAAWSIAALGATTVIRASTTEHRMSLFADEVGFPRSTPRDSIAFTVTIGTPVTRGAWATHPAAWPAGLVALDGETPCYVERAVSIRAEHNGFDGRFEKWTALDPEQQARTLKNHGAFLAEKLSKFGARSQSSDHAQLLRRLMMDGRSDFIDRRILWTNIPANLVAVVPAPIRFSLLAILLGTGITLYVVGRRRVVEGACDRCGYDLRATPTLDFCPECGSSTHNGYGPPDQETAP